MRECGVLRSLSVLVVTRDPGTALAELVAGWDAQSAAADAFEVVVADAGSTDGSAERLVQLADRRPNVLVRLLSADSSETQALAAALELATGRHVLALPQQRRLAPRAVELLARQAERTGADVVLGRVLSGSASGSFLLPTDVERFDPGQAAAALPTSCVAVRRELLLGTDDPAAVLLAPAGLLAGGPAIAAVGSSAVGTEPDAAEPSTDDLQLSEAEVGWEQGRLVVEVRASTAPTGGGTLAWLVAAPVGGSHEVTVPAELEPAAPTDPAGEDEEGAATRAGWRVRAVLDPTVIDAGAPLDDGVWSLRVRLAGPEGEATAALPSTPVSAAVLDGRLLTLPAPAGGLQLDVGATRTSVVGAVRPADASVVETAHGSLLTLTYPDVHVRGDSVGVARLRLDNFGLPARLVCRDGVARLECFVTGLAGSTVVTVFAGHGKPVRTGLNLDISETGQMTLVPTPSAAPPAPSAPPPAHPVAAPTRSTPPASAPAPTPAPSAGPSAASPEPHSRPPSGRAAAPLAQRLRRLAPPAVEPVVRRLSRVKPLRQAYRRLLRR